MNNPTVNLIILVLLVALLVGAFFAGRATVQPNIITKDSVVASHHWDTISIPQPPIYLAGHSNSTTYTLHDTITYQTKAFVDALDTTIVRDTFKLTYAFPQRYFTLFYKRHPDTTFVHTIDSSTTKYIQPSRWYTGLGIYLGAGYAPNSSLNFQIGVGLQFGYRIF